jgi:hypothetical protein
MADPVHPTAPVVSAEESRLRTEAATRARADAQAAAIKKLDEDDKARQEAIVEAGQRQLKMKPTPTQRENDLAKLGLLDIDSKEDDGSGPDPHDLQQRALTADAQGRYKTRDVNQPKR